MLEFSKLLKTALQDNIKMLTLSKLPLNMYLSYNTDGRSIILSKL